MLDWLRDIYNAIISYLQWFFGGGFINETIEWLLSIFPLSDGTAEAQVAPIAALAQWAAEFYSLGSYFVNLNFFFGAILFVLFVEYVILPFPRVWKLILDMVPFA